jgi:hypothetical protein
MPVHFFLDRSAGGHAGSPRGLPRPTRKPTRIGRALQSPAEQSLAVRLLCRVGSRFGVGEQAPSRIPASRCDPWEPGAHRHRTVWSWWCR